MSASEELKRLREEAGWLDGRANHPIADPHPDYVAAWRRGRANLSVIRARRGDCPTCGQELPKGPRTHAEEPDPGPGRSTTPRGPGLPEPTPGDEEPVVADGGWWLRTRRHE